MPSSDRFITERKGAWQRLEDLLGMLDRSSLRRLNREEVRELGRIYRRTASDLAIARAESRDPRLVNYLNSLVIRAHGRIYRADPAEGRRRVRDFFARDFPSTFRRTWRYTALAFGVCALFAALAFLGTWRDPEFSELAGVPPYARERILERKPRWWEEINQANQIAATGIATHNIMVTFNAFAFGALFGVGTLFYMAYNGASIGAIPRFDNLRLRGREAAYLIVGCVPLLAVAGTIEGFIPPAAIPPTMKFAIAAVTGLALYSYLLLAGRDDGSAK